MNYFFNSFRILKVILIILLCTVQHFSIETTKYNLILDSKLSPLSGATIIDSSYMISHTLKDRLFNDLNTIPISYSSWNNLKPYVSNPLASTLYRILGIYFLDLPFSLYLMSINHNVFGHGYRLREFDFSQIHYNIGAPFPYGAGHGYYSGTSKGNLFKLLETSIDSAGIESSTILSEYMFEKQFHSGERTYYNSLLSLISGLDLL